VLCQQMFISFERLIPLVSIAKLIDACYLEVFSVTATASEVVNSLHSC
jgi:hypothetical protein